jgi:hypothetical protein
MTSPVGSGPERVARQQIDQFLTEAGWIVQGREGINLSAGPGITIHSSNLIIPVLSMVNSVRVWTGGECLL